MQGRISGGWLPWRSSRSACAWRSAGDLAATEATQVTLPSTQFTSFRNGARFEDSFSESASPRVPDPTGESLLALRAEVQGLPEDEASHVIDEFLFPEVVIEGFKTKEEVYETVYQRAM